jgi:uncharacterized membrane protein
MGKVLLLAAIAWPLLLALALWERIYHPGALTGLSIYAAASTICHQIAERSFHTAGVQWPVCGRCAGLYAAAPFGAWLGLALAGGSRSLSALRLIALAALPGAATVAMEWARAASVGNVTRCISALPLGAAVAFVLVASVAPAPSGRSPELRG